MLLDTPNLKALITVSVDINHPLAEGYVRCHINFSVTLLEPLEDDPGRTRVTSIGDLELRGSIPESLPKYARSQNI